MNNGEDRQGPWTPLRIIQWAVPYLGQKGLAHPRLDAETLVAFALGIDRLKVYLQFDRPLLAGELDRIRENLKRRAQGEPVQHITGQREFFGLTLKAGPGALIPRPETEGLVERGLEFLKTLREEERDVLELGTGSGCISLAIARNIPCRIWATDLSPQALGLAQENAKMLGPLPIQWREGDWFKALGPEDPSQFPLILSNPPYIALSERAQLEPEVRDFEPHMALFGGEDGMEAYQAIGADLGRFLAPEGLALLELSANRSDNIKTLFEGGGWQGTLYPDLQGLPRILGLKKGTIR